MKEKAARWGFIALVLGCVGAVGGAILEAPLFGAIFLGGIPALIFCRFLFLALAGVQHVEPSRAGEAAVRAAGGFGRVIGWILGLAVASAAIAAMRGGCG